MWEKIIILSELNLILINSTRKPNPISWMPAHAEPYTNLPKNKQIGKHNQINISNAAQFSQLEYQRTCFMMPLLILKV